MNAESVDWKGCVKRKHTLEEGEWAPCCDDVTYVRCPQPVQGKASLITDGSPYKDDNTTRPSVTHSRLVLCIVTSAGPWGHRLKVPAYAFVLLFLGAVSGCGCRLLSAGDVACDASWLAASTICTCIFHHCASGLRPLVPHDLRNELVHFVKSRAFPWWRGVLRNRWGI